MRARLGVDGVGSLSNAHRHEEQARAPGRGRQDHTHTTRTQEGRAGESSRQGSAGSHPHCDTRTPHAQAGLTCSAEISSTSWRAFSMPSLVPVILI